MNKRLHAVLVCIAVSIIGLLNTTVLSPTLEVKALPTELWKDYGAIIHKLRIVILATFSISAAVSGLLVGWFGPQVVSMVGGMTVTIGLLTTVFISSETHVLITYGIVTGAGCGLVYVCIYEAVKMAYTIYRNFVYGMLGCVSYTGYFLGPWIFKALLTSYTWRGALLILVGIVMNIIPLSMLLPGGSGREHVPYQPLTEIPRSAEQRNGSYRSRGRKKGIHRSRSDLQSEDMETLWVPNCSRGDGQIAEDNGFRPRVMKVLRKTGFYALLFAGVLYAYGSSVVLGVIENYTETDLSETHSTFTLFIITGVTVCVWTLFQGAVIDRVEPLYWFTGFACVGGFLTFVFMLPVSLIVIYVYGGLLGMSIAGTGREIICPIITNLAGGDNFAFPFGIYVCLSSLARLLGCPTTSVWVYEKSQSHKPVFAMAAATMILPAIIAFLLRRKLKRRSGVREIIYPRRVVSQDDSNAELVTSV